MSFKRILGLTVAATALIGFAAGASAQTPKRGGTVIAGYEAGEPSTFDCHASPPTLVTLYFVAPHYSLLTRYDATAYPKVEGDLAESWTVSTDGLTYTFKLKPNVKFHDGSPLTSADIKASFDRIRNPPQGVVSVRRGDFADIASIDTPDAQTVVFKLSQPNAAMGSNFANPFNCIYSARKLAENPTYPATTIMGSGPFVPDQYVKGESWSGKRFDGYFMPGKPYLDGFKIILLAAGRGPTAMAGGQLDMFLRTMSPQELETITSVRKDAKIVSTPTLVETLVAFNTARKPFDDVRVRRALTLAVDRKNSLEPIMKISNFISTGTITRPGSDIVLPAADAAKLPGFGPDLAASRAEARRLLAEAGQSNLKFTLLNRPISSYNIVGLFAIGQWREIGVTVENNPLDGAPYTNAMSNGEYDVAVDINGLTAEDPSTLLQKYVPGAAANFGKYTDATLTDLFAKQKVSLDPAARKNLVHDFERRVLEQAYVAPMFWAGWYSAVGGNIHGWAQTPVYYVGYDMGAIWRD